MPSIWMFCCVPRTSENPVQTKYQPFSEQLSPVSGVQHDAVDFETAFVSSCLDKGFSLASQFVLSRARRLWDIYLILPGKKESSNPSHPCSGPVCPGTGLKG